MSESTPYLEDIVDLDEPRDTSRASESVTICSCGEKRSLLRFLAVRLCASQALARLKEAHRDEYDRYLAELKEQALAEFESRWRRHLGGDHR
ncbi:hypothetical protein B5P44_01295 [Mycobacterium sp. CBMA 213]|uniref:Uncharacterized protein n=1 Tax=Mycolicibacterium sp. CBMA 213 TaxID=1968788 RepID=A0A343VRQ5_9MYCO|nr:MULTISPECIES: hypothetical protein [unclassified Mycolicibacterium]AVN58579.1 hypothetical protein B5P44_p00284 [Mycolicibacterium sp. CBMA 213]MUL61219.1 hypothetical protein [Mycolicibacterium sp. CBMA 335]MUM03456.1 hypothetical protein [Mycolicibacterium sp. CBMA 213]